VQEASKPLADASSLRLPWHQIRVVYGVPVPWSAALSHLHHVIPGRTYLSPLWYSIVNSGDHKHLVSGTQVKALSNTEEAIAYATAYANKATQKLTKSEGVGRFWGSSRSLVSSIVELEDLSIRQLQHLRSNYLSSFGRLDRMNCYLWGGSEWGKFAVTISICTFVPYYSRRKCWT